MPDRTSPLIRSRLAPFAVAAAAAVPVAWMVHEVWQASAMPHLDYWGVLRHVLGDDGAVHWRALVELRNEHPFVVPTLIYLLNVRVTGGNNIALGLYSVAVTVALLFVLWQWLRGDESLRSRRGAAIVAASALLFSPHGVHNYVLGISGVAWLTTNLLVALALGLQAGGRSIAALGLALVASATYGTGLAAWPALAVVAWQGRQAHWRRWLPLGVGLVVTALYAWGYARPVGSPPPTRDPFEIGRTLTALLGQLTGDDRDLATAAGTALLVIAGWLVTRGIRQGDAAGAAWSGLVVWSVAAAALVSTSRAGFGAEVSLSSRYASIAALCVVGVGALALRRRAAAHAEVAPDLAVIAIVAGIAMLSGGQETTALRSLTREQDELAIAVRVGAAEHYPRTPGTLAPVLKHLAHYPFNDRFRADCGLLGQRIAPTTGTADAGELEVQLQPYGPSATRIAGWVRRPSEVACLVIVDGSGTVVGAGVLGHLRHDIATRLGVADYYLGWQAVAPASSLRPLRAVVVDRTGGRTQLPGAIATP